jgi:hypothetical protein
MREALGVPDGPAAQVRFIADSMLCRRSIEALNLGRDSARVARVWVYQLPDGYAVDSPGLYVPGDGADLYFLDPRFRYRSIVNGF